MGEMIERVARAIATARLCSASCVEDEDRAAARAAIEAMREPTEAMVNTAYDALAEYDYAAPGACTVAHAHRAMIDAALAEKPR